MSALSSWSETQKYTLWGALFGFCFPLGSILFLFLIGELGTHPHGLRDVVIAAHRNKLLFVIDSAPFFLGLFARLAGMRQDRIRRFNESLEVEVAEKTESLTRALADAQKANDMIAHMAEHDPLTGLLNRRRFEKELRRSTEYAKRYQRRLALIFIDLDNFKNINDEYGHTAGDGLIVAAADTLNQAVRSTDLIARWGGDEFAILLPETDEVGAIEAANKLLRTLNERTVKIRDAAFTITASLGVSLLPTHTLDPDELLAFADGAMYRAKEGGRNRWHLYSATARETERAQEQVRWGARLRRALETDQFVLLYQPVVHLSTAHTANYEALVRMEDRDGRLINPGVFLEYAEQFNLSTAIDCMVLRKALRRLSELHTDNVWISVNISRSTLGDERFLKIVADLLKQTGVPPERLGFELNERLLLEQLGRSTKLATELKALGCRVILDDFGAHLATLRNLRQLPLDLIKLDGALVRKLADPQERRIAETATQIARDLGIQTVAKFVEDNALLLLVRDLGIDYAQGFALGRPIEAIEPNETVPSSA